MNRRNMSPREIRRENLVIATMACLMLVIIGLALYAYFGGWI